MVILFSKAVDSAVYYHVESDNTASVVDETDICKSAVFGGDVTGKAAVGIHSHENGDFDFAFCEKLFKLHSAVYREVDIFESDNRVGIRQFIEFSADFAVEVDM